jgi:hypothetical protein
VAVAVWVSPAVTFFLDNFIKTTCRARQRVHS